MLKNKYLSLAQIAVMKGFTTAHLRRMVLTGRLKAEKIGKSWVVESKEAAKITRQRNSKNKDV